MSKTASAKPPEPREVIDTRGAFRSGLRGAPDRERGGQPQRMAWRSDPGGPYSRPAHSVITRGRDSRRSERTPHEARSCGEGADEDVLSDYVLAIRPSIDLPEQCGCMEGDAGAARRARRDLRNAFERRLRIRPTALTTADRLRHLVAGTGDFHRREVGRQAIGGRALPSHSASVRMTRDTHSGNPTARVRTSSSTTTSRCAAACPDSRPLPARLSRRSRTRYSVSTSRRRTGHRQQHVLGREGLVTLTASAHAASSTLDISRARSAAVLY